ncbi:hypothetical protein [Streptomyces lydicus]|uniref:hypothetical protein n=2 Tax=Streptomyces lydicus TaxID=47763 RepID=UPI0036EDC628
MMEQHQGEPAANGLRLVPAGRHKREGPVRRPPHTGRTRGLRRPAGPRQVALLIPAAALLILVSGAASSLRWMFVPSLALGLAGGIWLIVTVPPLLPHPALSRLMMTLLAVPAVAAAVLAAFASQGFVLETRGEVRSGEVTRVIEHQGKTTSYECVIRYHSVTEAPGTLNCGKSAHVGATVQVAWDPGGLVEPDFAEAKGTYRFFAILAMVSEIALVILGELTVAMGVVLRAAHRVSTARGPGTADGPEAAVGR